MIPMYGTQWVHVMTPCATSRTHFQYKAPPCLIVGGGSLWNVHPKWKPNNERQLYYAALCINLQPSLTCDGQHTGTSLHAHSCDLPGIAEQDCTDTSVLAHPLLSGNQGLLELMWTQDCIACTGNYLFFGSCHVSRPVLVLLTVR